MLQVILAALVLAGGAAAHAGKDEIEQARQHFLRGRKLYDLQRFAEAAAEYERAYELKDDPSLLFNIGQAFRGAGAHQKAIGAYRAYLRRVPDSPERAAIVARIDELQKLLEEQKQAQERPPSGTLPPAEAPGPATTSEPPSKPVEAPKPPPSEAPEARHRRLQQAGRMRIAGLVTSAVGLLGVAAGGVVLSQALSLNERWANPPPGEDGRPPPWSDAAVEDQAAAQRLHTGAIALFAVGGAALVAGVTVTALGFVRARPGKLALVPSLAPSSAGLVAVGSF